MTEIADPILHSMIVAAAVGALALVGRIIVVRSGGRTQVSEALGCIGLVAVIAILAVLVVAAAQ